MKRGEIWWASLPDPRDSEPGYRHPVLVLQSDRFTQSAIRTVIAAVITSNLKLASAPGNVLLRKRESRLPSDSVVNVSQLMTLSKRFFVSRVGSIPGSRLNEVEDGLRLILSL